VSNEEQLRRVLVLIHEVAAEQQTAAEEGERAYLDEYCDDVHANGLATLSQALRHAAELLSVYDAGSYQVHVALRTLRTAEQAEHLQPSRVTEWRMHAQARPGGRAEISVDADKHKGRGKRPSYKEHHEEHPKRGSRIDAASIKSFKDRKDAPKDGTADNSFARKDTSFRRRVEAKSTRAISSLSAEMRSRIQQIYAPPSQAGEDAAGEDAAAIVAAASAGGSGGAAKSAVGSGGNSEVGGSAGKAGDGPTGSGSEAVHDPVRRRHRRPGPHGAAAQVLNDMHMDSDREYAARAKEYIRQLRAQDPRLALQAIVLGVE